MNYEIVARGDNTPAPATGTAVAVSDAAKTGVAPLNSFTGGSDGHRGPVLATVNASASSVWAVVDPAAEVPSVRVYCSDPASPYAEAARRAQISQSGERLTVTVPRINVPPMRHGNAMFHNYGSSSFVSSGDVFVGGNMTITGNSGVMINGHKGVEIEIVLPAGSGLKTDSDTGSVHALGQLAAAQIESSSGSVHLESVGRAEIEASAGSVRVGTVTEWISVDASAGSVNVAHHAGQNAKIRASAGSVKFTIASAASGKVDVRSSAGSVKVYGSRGRNDMEITAKASAGSVKHY